MQITAYQIAARYVGVKETAGTMSNPVILGMLRLDNEWPQSDAVPWCSAFASHCAWLLRLPRSKSLAARSWLSVGTPITLTEARVGFDVVVLNRGGSPDPDVAGPGHVGFFAGLEGARVVVLGGNQSDAVSLARFQQADVLGVRRLHDEPPHA